MEAKLEDSKYHDSWLTWIKLRWADLQASQSAMEIWKTMEVDSIHQYISHVTVHHSAKFNLISTVVAQYSAFFLYRQNKKKQC